ncbi:MAG TPA: hypothetical protein VHT04_12030 [Stellaceae bacterium]|jgi:hypothetical protein|nr:hypothetical protein [Stellaceae bacterium]
MRRPAAVLLLAGAVLAAGPALQRGLAAQPPSNTGGITSADPGFVAGTEDIPLMPGLRNQESTLVVFDKPQGRIVEIEARGKVTRAAAEKFYAASLPPLGWIAEGSHRWRRDGEGLRLDIKGHDGDLRVGFSLAPR